MFFVDYDIIIHTEASTAFAKKKVVTTLSPPVTHSSMINAQDVPRDVQHDQPQKRCVRPPEQNDVQWGVRMMHQYLEQEGD